MQFKSFFKKKECVITARDIGTQHWLSIHEILHAVFRHVRPGDLGNCLAVCRVWWSICSPLLWQHKKLRVSKANSYYEKASSRVVLQRIGMHVRRLAVSEAKALSAVSASCPNVCHLYIDDDRVMSWPLIVAYLESCPKLDTLVFSRWYGGGCLSEIASVLSHTTITTPMSKHLRELSITTSCGRQQSTCDLVDLLFTLPSLITLRIFQAGNWRVDHQDALLKSRTFLLQELDIYNEKNMIMDNIRFLLPIWRQCPDIRRLQLDKRRLLPADFDQFVALFEDTKDEDRCTRMVRVPTITQPLPRRRVQFLSMPNRCNVNISDEHLARILEGCAPQHLKTLWMGSCSVGPRALTVLLKTQTESLEELVIDGEIIDGFCPSPLIRQLLATCPRLRRLSAKADTSNMVKAGHLLVDDWVPSEWACKGLQQLAIMMYDPTTQSKRLKTFGIVNERRKMPLL